MILCERDLDEVLDSQERMLARRNQPLDATTERRRMLKDEYVRTLGRARAMLARRLATQVLVVQHSHVISDPLGTAESLNKFLGGGLAVSKIAAAVDPALHRVRVVS